MNSPAKAHPQYHPSAKAIQNSRCLVKSKKRQTQAIESSAVVNRSLKQATKYPYPLVLMFSQLSPTHDSFMLRRQ